MFSFIDPSLILAVLNKLNINYTYSVSVGLFNPLNAKLNPICHLLALVGAHHILHVSRVRVNINVTTIFLCKIFVLTCLMMA